MTLNPQCSRRTLFAGSGAVAGASLLASPFTSTALADGSVIPGLEHVTYGYAALTAAARGSTVMDGKVYVASRHVVSEGTIRLGVVDPYSGEVLDSHDLDIQSANGTARLANDGRYIYIGPQRGAWVWRFDPQTAELEQFFEYGTPSHVVYSLEVVGEYLYVGNFPDCELFRVHLETREALSFGRVGPSQYATCVDMNDEWIAAGTSAPGALKVYDHDGNELHDLTEFLEESPVGLLDLVVANGQIYASCGRFIITMQPDGSGRVVRPIAEEDRYIDNLMVMPDGRVLALARLTSSYYEVTESGLTHLGQPWQNVENVGFFPDGDDAVIGVTGLGHVWSSTIGGEASVFPLSQAGFGYPEPTQSILHHSNGDVWVGGHFAITVHHAPKTASGEPEISLIEVNGEPKSMVELPDGRVVAGLYPSTSVVAISPDGYTQETLGVIDNDQMRPLAMAYDEARGQVVIPTTAKHQIHTGGVTFANPTTGSFEVRRDLLPDQNINNVAIEGDFAYFGGDIYAEAKDEAGPASVASIIEVDLRTREVTRVLEPVDWEAYGELAVTGGVLYGLANRPAGEWFALDLATEEIIATGSLRNGGGLAVHSGRVLFSSKQLGEVYELSAEDGGTATLLYSGMEYDFHNRSDFAVDVQELGLWGLDGVHLAWFPLPADESEPTPTPDPDPDPDPDPTTPPDKGGKRPGLPSTGR